MEEDDFFVENLIDTKKQTKKINGCRKGKSVERQLCKLLTDHFNDSFSRSIGSGNRWSQVELPQFARKVFSGDICVPENFLWVIECKGGYEDEFNLNNVCDGSIAILDKFIEQSSRDAKSSDRKPIILWKRNRKPWLAVVRSADVSKYKFENMIIYGKWVIINFEQLLEVTDRKFWYGANND